MKVFIAGARAIKDLDEVVKAKLLSISNQNYDVLIGDCYGIDSAVQEFYLNQHYNNITIFASNGIVRNNIGNWRVENIKVESKIQGFDFYKQKDIAMADVADCGFMIWDGKSRGTLNNIINLAKQNKTVLIYMKPISKMIVIRDIETLTTFISICPIATQSMYNKLTYTQLKLTS